MDPISPLDGPNPHVYGSKKRLLYPPADFIKNVLFPRVVKVQSCRVATRDAASGRKIFIDAMVTCAQCGFGPRQQARAGRDGVAAPDAVRVKRRRYPPRAGSWFR